MITAHEVFLLNLSIHCDLQTPLSNLFSLLDF